MPASRHEAACCSGSMALLGAISDIGAGIYDLVCVAGVEVMGVDTANVKEFATVDQAIGAHAWPSERTQEEWVSALPFQPVPTGLQRPLRPRLQPPWRDFPHQSQQRQVQPQCQGSGLSIHRCLLYRKRRGQSRRHERFPRSRCMPDGGRCGGPFSRRRRIRQKIRQGASAGVLKNSVGEGLRPQHHAHRTRREAAHLPGIRQPSLHAASEQDDRYGDQSCRYDRRPGPGPDGIARTASASPNT